MKKNDFPQNVTIGKQEWSAAMLIRNGVLTLPFWKETCDLKLVDACLAIDRALDADPMKTKLSDDAQAFLAKAMATASVTDGAINQYFMKCYSSVLRAEDCEE